MNKIRKMNPSVTPVDLPHQIIHLVLTWFTGNALWIQSDPIKTDVLRQITNKFPSEQSPPNRARFLYWYSHRDANYITAVRGLWTWSTPSTPLVIQSSNSLVYTITFGLTHSHINFTLIGGLYLPNGRL